MLLASTPWKLLRDDVNSAQLFPSVSSSFATTASTSSMRALLPAVISWIPPKFSASSILSFAGRRTFLCRAACRTRFWQFSSLSFPLVGHEQLPGERSCRLVPVVLRQLGRIYYDGSARVCFQLWM